MERTKSVCLFCSVGCGTEIVTRAGRILRVEGEWEEHNNGVLCYKGRFEPFKEERERIETPLARKEGQLVAVSWEEALDTLAQALKATPKEKIGAWATCRNLNLTLSEFVAVFMGKIGAGQMGVLELTLARFNLPLGGSLNDLLTADTILVTGADPLTDHPVIGYHIKRACMKGARLILVSDNHNAMGRFAHQTYDLEDMSKAVRVCQNSNSPVVLYGEETPPLQAEKLAVLQRKANFIPPLPRGQRLSRQGLGITGQLCAESDGDRLSADGRYHTARRQGETGPGSQIPGGPRQFQKSPDRGGRCGLAVPALV